MIADNQIYTLANFKDLTGLGDHALRTMRRQGLCTISIGGRTFISGRHFREFAEQLAIKEQRVDTDDVKSRKAQ